MIQRAATDFHEHLKKSSTEMNDLIQRAYGTEAMTQFKVFEWCEEFCDTRTVTKRANDSSRPRTVRTKIMVNTLATLIYVQTTHRWSIYYKVYENKPEMLSRYCSEFVEFCLLTSKVYCGEEKFLIFWPTP